MVLSAMTDAEGNPLIQPGQAITVVGESGELAFTVATGFLDADFQSGRGNERGTAPDLYIRSWPTVPAIWPLTAPMVWFPALYCFI